MKAGSVVSKKTGGYIMTVRRLIEDTAVCVYFDEEQKHCSEIVLIAELNVWEKIA